MKTHTRYILPFVCFLSSQVFAANIEIKNNDGPGEGFNDPTAAANIAAQLGNNPGATLGEARLNVFQAAADAWGEVLKSSVKITVGSEFNPLPCTMSSGTLGQAGATSSRANFAGANPGVAYGIALAESIASTNFNGTNVEIDAEFNSDVDANASCLGGGGFYYGLDGNTPTGMIALMPVVLHEIGHGLGFSSFADAGPGGNGGFHSAGGFPDPFSSNLLDLDTGKTWDQMTNNERKASALNAPQLVWNGAQVTADHPMLLGKAPEFVINSPAAIAGTFDTVLGDEPGATIPAMGVTGGVFDGQTFMDLDNDLADGCSQVAFGGTFAGRLVLWDATENCSPLIQAFWAQFEGATGVIIASTEANGLPDIRGVFTDPTITIPYIGVESSVGASIRSRINTANVTIRNSPTELMGANGGKVKMFAPPEFSDGSSVSHWDTSASPNLLMEPSINADLPFLGLDITPAALQDTGWTLLNGAPEVPAKPTGIKATDGTFSDRVRVTFNTVPNATVYRVFRCTTAGQTCGSPIGFPKTGTFDDTKGVPGTIYYYRVRGCNAAGCGKFSAANTGFSSAAPAKPTGIKATDGTFSDKVRVTFNLVPGATVYRVFRCMSAGQTCGSPIGFPKTGVFDDTNGVAGTIYYYRVRACTATTCGKFSAANTGFRSTGPSLPGKPTTVRASDGSFPARVRVTWDKVTGAFVYRVYRCPMMTGSCGSPVGFPKNPVFDDRNGTSGVIYYYRVRACTQTGLCGKFSAQNPGHRGTIPSAKGDARIEAPIMNTAVPIPVLGGPYGRTILIMMMLGLGLTLIRRGRVPARDRVN